MCKYARADNPEQLIGPNPNSGPGLLGPCKPYLHELAAHVAGKGRDELVFTARTGRRCVMPTSGRGCSGRRWRRSGSPV